VGAVATVHIDARSETSVDAITLETWGGDDVA